MYIDCTSPVGADLTSENCLIDHDHDAYESLQSGAGQKSLFQRAPPRSFAAKRFR